MSEGEVKTLAITGGAADHYRKLRGTRKRRNPAPLVGGDLPPGQSLASPANYNAARRLATNMKVLKGGAEKSIETLPGSNPPNPVNLQTPAVNANLKVGAMPPTQQQHHTGGSKILLAPPKKKTKTSVLLAPPATKKHSKGKGIHQTRKIRVQLSGLKTRLTRAKTIHKDSREKSIADVRKVLEESKLVKPAKEGKEVPESVLRDIYKDYLLLRNKAL